MAYDLLFWRHLPGPRADPQAIAARLYEGQSVQGLADLPIEEWLAAVAAVFAGSVREPNPPGEWLVWEAPDGRASFQLEWSPHHVLVTCRWLPPDDMNTFIDIGARFGCPLFDPQTGERFDFRSGS